MSDTLRTVRTLSKGFVTAEVGKGGIESYGADRSKGEYPEIAKEYKIRIMAPRSGGYDLVLAYMSENFREQVVSKWSNLMKVENSIVDTVMTYAAGKTLKTLSMYRQVWDGNDPFKGKLKLIFDANPVGGEPANFDFAQEYVMKPIRALQKMASPGLSNLLGKDIEIGGKSWNLTLLTPPILASNNPSAESITIGIGTGYEYRGCIITNVGPEYLNVMSDTGYPIHAEVDLDFQVIQPVTKQDYNRVM